MSDIGSATFTTTVVIWIGAVLAAGESWAPLAVSSVLVAQALPQLVLRPMAGVFVDRWDVRRTMLRVDGLRAALIASLTLVTVLTTPIIWRLAAIDVTVMLVSLGGQFFNPALFTLIGDLVPHDERSRASGLSETTWNVAAVVGPPLAAPLLFVFGAQWALAVDALSFVASYVTLRAMRTPTLMRPAAERVGRWFPELGEGLQFSVRNRVVRVVTLALGVAMLGAGALHALEFFFVTENLHASPVLYGLIGPAFGVGSIVGALLAGQLAPRLGVSRTFAVSMTAVGVALLALARQTSLAPALVIYMLFGVVNSGANVAMLSLLLAATPRTLAGRVNALVFTVISAVSLASSAGAGYLDSTLLRDFHLRLLGISLGPIDTLLSVAGFCICLGGIYAWTNLQN